MHQNPFQYISSTTSKRESKSKNCFRPILEEEYETTRTNVQTRSNIYLLLYLFVTYSSYISCLVILYVTSEEWKTNGWYPWRTKGKKKYSFLCEEMKNGYQFTRRGEIFGLMPNLYLYPNIISIQWKKFYLAVLYLVYITDFHCVRVMRDSKQFCMK